MLNNVMPKRGAFFNLLAAHTDRLVAGASATLRLITGLGNQGEHTAGLIEEVAGMELNLNYWRYLAARVKKMEAQWRAQAKFARAGDAKTAETK